MRRSNRSADSSVWREFRVTGKVEMFPVDNPWIYVNVPQEHTEATRHLADRGLVAITATLGSSEWNTSLMPKGDGTQFIPLPAKIRKAENIEIGDHTNISFVLRKR
jgi:Domain of unknown function (DUF1905)